jgi:type I site-specific restriction endonuclease
MNETDSEASASHAYFQAIEETFVRLRGAPLLLSPTDWQVARQWYEQGIPVTLVRDALEDLFARRKEKGARGRIQSLRYCAGAVEERWRQVQELQTAGVRQEAAQFDVEARLRALAEALPSGLDNRRRWADRIRGLEGSASEVEQRLTACDAEILSAAEASLDDHARQELASAVETALGRIVDRVDSEEIDQIRDRLTLQALRRMQGLPVLSLFSVEAEAGEED